MGAALIESVTSLPARADWAYTRWGMTPEEVQSASDGEAVPLDPAAAATDMDLDPETTLLQTRWSVEEFDFQVFLNFTGNEPRLTEVILKAEGHNRGELGEALIERYGPPKRGRAGLSRSSQNTRFQLVESPEFARPEPSPQTATASGEPMRIIMEWETPDNFIQYSRRGASEVLIHVQPLKTSSD